MPLRRTKTASSVVRNLLLTLLLVANIAKAEDEPIADFLQAVRHPPLAESWAIMQGTIRHKAKGAKKTQTLPIALRMRLSPARIFAQLISGDERYLIGQNFADGLHGTSVIPEQRAPEGATTLADVGIRPSDMTLSFLYWEFVDEREADRVGGRACRVVSLAHIEAREHVKVWISKEFRFPLRVHWFKADAKEPYRQLEFAGFEKIDNTWIVKEVDIRNTGWKTEVLFSNNILHHVNDKPVPDDLFLD
ncbi:MAG: hypothetical protein ACI8W8_000599 [Rhodothermales bacterium]|jgi:hypothetical protein